MSAVLAIITRTRNRPLLLRRAIRSVLEQTRGDWLHVIVNDGGERGPVDALVAEFDAAYAGRVRVLHNLRSTGMEAASNLGIRASQSRYVAIHDDDDSWHPAFVESMVGLLEERAGSITRGAVCLSVLVEERIEGEQVVESARRVFDPSLRAISLPRLAQHNLFPPISFVFARGALDSTGLFDESLPVLGDWDFNLRFCAQFDIEVLPRELAFWHHRTGSQDPQYGNSVIAGVQSHHRQRAALVNALTRKAIREGTTSLARVVASGEQSHGVEGMVREDLAQVARRIDELCRLGERVDSNAATALAALTAASERVESNAAALAELRAASERMQQMLARTNEMLGRANEMLGRANEMLTRIDARVASVESVFGRLHALSERAPLRWLKRLLRA